jgi:D-alanyl-lipoteichoic acid acyltransferase DltB (MBOAT superfamily)
MKRSFLTKPLLLLGTSLFIGAFAFPAEGSLPLLISWAALNYLMVRLTAGHVFKSGSVFYPALAINVSLLAYLKFFYNGGQSGVPTGISFFCFQLISFLVDLRRGKIPSVPAFVDYLLYLFYLPKFFAGPIERFVDFSAKVRVSRPFSGGRIRGALYLCGVGAFKFFLISEEARRAIDLGEGRPGGILDGIALIYLSALQLYCEFSGFVDMAKGDFQGGGRGSRAEF